MKNRKIKTVVVEDEVLLLKNITKKILQTNSSFEVVGTAYNGAEALEIIEKTLPEVVFTDIRMPMMDGLELAGILKRKYSSIFLVIISGYDDFEYARRAIGYGVSNYLLKPVQRTQLEETLDILEKKILVRAKDEAWSLIREQLHQTGGGIDKEDLGEYLEKKRFGMFLICVGNLRIRGKNQGETGNLKLGWSNILKGSSCRAEESYIFEEAQNQRLILLEGCGESWNKTAQKLLNHIKEVFPDMSVNISYMQEDVPWEMLHVALREVRQRLFANLKVGDCALLPNGMEVPEFPPAVLQSVTVSHLQALFNSNNEAGIKTAVLQMFGEWERGGYSQQWIEKMVHQILILFQQCLFFSEVDYDRMFQNVFSSLEREGCLENAAVQIAGELADWGKRNQPMPSEIEDAIEQMSDYIHKHYTEPINLAELSEKYHFNHSYITRLFKKTKGQTPLKLIHALRMADAMEMLKNKELSIREISETLGFADQHYFSRIFKEAAKVTPKEYRSMMEK